MLAKYNVLGCPVLNILSDEDIQKFIKSRINNKRGFYSVAINAEKIMQYCKNPEMTKVIDNSNLPYPDGSGAVLGLRVLNGVSSTKINMPVVILEICNKNKIPLFMIGSSSEVIDVAVTKVLDKYKNLPLVGYHHGFFKDELNIIQTVKESGAKVIMIAMGSPKQEQLAQRMLEELPDCIFIGCGGAFDILAGKVMRAPVWVQNTHIEWLYRLIQDPRRIKRQIVLPFFLVLVLKEYFKKAWFSSL